jgi:Asp-tRNA(Asn)/Glu-tRNA(Gln) amidotransferase A subunit family amidase
MATRCAKENGLCHQNSYAPSNLTEDPMISVACSFTHIGMPIGMQIVGKAFDKA